MTVESLRQIDRKLRQIDHALSEHRVDLINLRDRIANATGATYSSPYTVVGGTVGGTINAGAGLLGGGSLPGTVNLSVNQGYSFIWTGNHVFDDGSGDSPSLSFVGGSNDDAVSMWLDDDAVAGDSGLAIKLADAAGDSKITIYDSGDSPVLTIDSNGLVDGVDISTHVHDGGAGDAPQLDWDTCWSDAVHDHSSAAEGDTTIGATLFNGIATVSAVWDHTADLTVTGATTTLAGFDVSEDSLYINNTGGVATPPTYRGALTVSPAVNTQRGQVIQAVASQSANLWELRDDSGTLLVRGTSAGDLESGTFTSGLVGWAIDHDGNAEFWNAFIRGELHASIFVADEMHARGGTDVIRTSFKVADAISAGDNTLPALDSSFTLVAQASWDTGLSYIADDDVLRLKFMADDGGSGLDLYDIYLEVDGTPSSNSDRDLSNGNPGTFDVNVIRRSGGATSVEIPSGTGGVVWGQVQQAADSYTGGILLTSDLNYAPYIDIFTVPADGDPSDDDPPPPWEAGGAPTPRVRLGNLDGVLGLSEQWGIALGVDLSDTSQAYMVASDLGVDMYGIAQTWWDGGGTARAEIDPTATGTNALMWAGPSSSDKRFIITGDGDVWLSSLGVSSSMGDFFFSNADGLLLIDFQKIEEISSSWYIIGSRGEQIGVSGALHQEQGRWAGTRGLIPELGATNIIDNPLMYDGDTNDRADNWGRASTGINGTINESIVERRRNGWWQQTDYTGVSGDSGADYRYYWTSDAASFAPNDDASFSIDIKGSATGCSVRIRLQILDNVPAQLDVVSQTVTLSEQEQRVSVSYTTMPANTDRVRVWVQITDIDNGDDVDISFGGAQLEATAYATPLAHGGMGEGYAWNTTENDDPTVRTVTDISLDTYADLIHQNTTVSYHIIAQAPWDSSDTDTPTYWTLFDADDTGVNDRIALYFTSSLSDFSVQCREGGSNDTDSTSGISFSKGDWLHLVLTLDYSSDERKLYVNDVLEIDTDCGAQGAPDVTRWSVGNTAGGASQWSAAITEYAVFDRVLTAEEVSGLYKRARALVDAGAIERPGITILNGEFKILSSTAGQRVEIVPAGVGIYEDDGITSVGRLLGGAVNTTSKALDDGSSDLGWFGYDSSNNLQVAWYGSGSNAGQIVAGGGVVILNEDGEEIEASTSYADVRSYKFVSGASTISAMQGYIDGTDNALRLYSLEQSGLSSTVRIYGNAGTTGANAQVILQASSNSAGSALVSCYAYESGVYAGQAFTTISGGTLNVRNNVYIAASGTDSTRDLHIEVADPIVRIQDTETTAASSVSYIEFGYGSTWTRNAYIGPASGSNVTFYVNNELGNIQWNVTDNGRMYLSGNGSSGELRLGTNLTSDDSKMTYGLKIDQSTADDNVISLNSSSDVSHSVTDLADAECYGYMRKFNSTGGLSIVGIQSSSSSTVAASLSGVTMDTTPSETHSESGRGIVEIWSHIHDGSTGVAAPTGDDNLLAIRAGGTGYTRALFTADGDLYLDTSLNEGAWDEYDDIGLLHGLRASLVPDGHELRERFGEWIDYARPILEGAGIVSYNDGPNDTGNPFISMRGLQYLTIDAIRQVGERMARYERALMDLGVDPKLLN